MCIRDRLYPHLFHQHCTAVGGIGTGERIQRRDTLDRHWAFDHPAVGVCQSDDDFLLSQVHFPASVKNDTAGFLPEAVRHQRHPHPAGTEAACPFRQSGTGGHLLYSGIRGRHRHHLGAECSHCGCAAHRFYSVRRQPGKSPD